MTARDERMIAILRNLDLVIVEPLRKS
jgi:hypothetical protein